MRLLRYAKESNNLFFTTTLQNSVQSYSVQHSKLLDPSHEHPSPPSVFALSCNSKFLLSTSAAPPTIHLNNLNLNMAPVLVRPECSASAVVAASSHPERENYFLLAFADGTAAVIDAMHFFHKHGKGEQRAQAAYSGTGGEVAFIKKLHATGTSMGSSNTDGNRIFNGLDSGTGTVGIGPRASGVTAVAFVPGRTAVAVTVGADGKCCVIDFTQSTPDKAVLLKSWHLKRPATSLSIVCYAQKSAVNQKITQAAAVEELNGTYCIAIGRDDGRVLLFDLSGTPLGEQALDAKGARVIDVEWTKIGSNNDDGIQPHNTRNLVANPKEKALGGSVLTHDLSKRVGTLPAASVLVEPDDEPPFDSSTPQKEPELSPLDLDSGEAAPRTIQRSKTIHAGAPKLGAGNATADRVQRSQRASIDGSGTTSHRPPATRSPMIQAGLMSSCSPPTVPPRPTPKPGGKLSMRHAQTSPYAPPNVSSQALVPTTSSSTGRRYGIIFGPREQKSPENQTLKTTATPSGESSPNEQLHDGSSDVAPAPPQHLVKVPLMSSDESGKSYNTASSHVQSSEASTDTIVDWSTALSRIPAPSLQPSQLGDTSPTPTKANRRHQVSLSPSSTPRGTSNSESPVSSGTADSPAKWPGTNDNVVDWPVGLDRRSLPFLQLTKHTDRSPIASKLKQKGHISLSASSVSRGTSPPVSSSYHELPDMLGQSPVALSQESIPAVRITRPSGEVAVKTNLEQKGHISLSVSSATSNTIATVSSGSEGPIVEWPSLKKSPPIDELNRISSLSRYEPSATVAILENYPALYPSPLKFARRRTNSPPKLPERRSLIPNPAPLSIALTSPELHACTCESALELTIQPSLTALRAEMAQQFEAQRSWLEELVKDGQEERVILAADNRLLRAELARSERGKGKKRSPRAVRD